MGAAPTTNAPTAVPTTEASTAAPTTNAPTATTKAPTAVPTTKVPTAAPTFLATTPEYTLEKICDDGRCRGAPSGGYGGLGKQVTLQECKQACLDSVTCKFVVYKKSNGYCSEYTKCRKKGGKFVRKGRALETWQKVIIETPSPTPSTRRLLIV